jgi:hypothetical protein
MPSASKGHHERDTHDPQHECPGGASLDCTGRRARREAHRDHHESEKAEEGCCPTEVERAAPAVPRSHRTYGRGHGCSSPHRNRHEDHFRRLPKIKNFNILLVAAL